MFLLTGPRWVAALLLLVYLAFLGWYDGRGAALTPVEIDGYISRIRSIANTAGVTPDEILLGELKQLAASDDGKEFFMLNLINYHQQAQYPAGSALSGTGLEADARYNRAIVLYLLKHGGHPVFLGTPMGRFIDQVGDVHWQRVALVRYRSRRDLLNMVIDLAAKPIAIHKWASIEKTQVFPVSSFFNLIQLRGLVAVVLVLIGLAIHLLLRRRRFYTGTFLGATQ